MKTLNPDFTSFKDAPSSAPCLLAVFHFSSGDVFVSDRSVVPTGGPAFQGLVASWGSLESPGHSLFEIALSQIKIEMANSGAPPFSSYLEAGTGEDTEVELFLWFWGLDYAKKEPVGRFLIGSPVKYSDGLVSLVLVNAFTKNNRLVGRKISRDDYPGADPDAIGRAENIIYGSPRNVPCQAVVAGAASTLVSDITDSQTAGIELSLPADGISFPASGTLQIGNEQITYAGFSNRVLTGVARGASGTVAVAHKKGAAAFEVRSDFTYLVAGHPVKDIGDVYVGGVRVQSGVDRLTDSGGKAKVVLGSRFTLEKAVSLDVSQGSHSHGSLLWFGAGSWTSASRWTAAASPGWTVNQWVNYAFMDADSHYFLITGNGANYVDIAIMNTSIALKTGSYTGTILQTQVYNVFQDTQSGSGSTFAGSTVGALNDGSNDVWGGCAVSGAYIDTARSFAVSDKGRIVGVRLCTTIGHPTYNGTGRSAVQSAGTFNGQSVQGGGSAKTSYKTAGTMTKAGDVAWSDIAGVSLRFTWVGGNAALGWEHWLEVYYVPYGGGASPATGVALSGNSAADIVVGGPVTCDVDGYADDANGTCTGTPGAVIENPADVFRHFLMTYLEVPGSGIGPSFTDARNSLSLAMPGGYSFAGVIDRQADGFAVIEDLCWQSRLKLLHDGYVAKLKFISNAPAVDKPVSAANVRRSGLSLLRTEKGETINSLDIHYVRDWTRPSSPENYLGIAGSSADYPASGDPASVAAYGQRFPAKPFLFGFVRDAGMASDMRDFYIARYKDRKRRVLLDLFLDCFELEEGDVIGLDYYSPALSTVGAKFIVEKAAYLPGSLKEKRADGIFIQAREL